MQTYITIRIFDYTTLRVLVNQCYHYFAKTVMKHVLVRSKIKASGINFYVIEINRSYCSAIRQITTPQFNISII